MILRLSRPFEADGRLIESLAIAGDPGSERLPINFMDGEAELDVREVTFAISKRVGLSMSEIGKIDPMDRLTLMLLIFEPAAFWKEPKPVKGGKK